MHAPPPPSRACTIGAHNDGRRQDELRAANNWQQRCVVNVNAARLALRVRANIIAALRLDRDLWCAAGKRGQQRAAWS